MRSFFQEGPLCLSPDRTGRASGGDAMAIFVMVCSPCWICLPRRLYHGDRGCATPETRAARLPLKGSRAAVILVELFYSYL